jgi:hypothetical protein
MKQYDTERRKKKKEEVEYKNLQKQLKLMEDRAVIQEQINNKKKQIEKQKQILQINSSHIRQSSSNNRRQSVRFQDEDEEYKYSSNNHPVSVNIPRNQQEARRSDMVSPGLTQPQLEKYMPEINNLMQTITQIESREDHQSSSDK